MNLLGAVPAMMAVCSFSYLLWRIHLDSDGHATTRDKAVVIVGLGPFLVQGLALIVVS